MSTHTGHMHAAFENAAQMVNKGGQLFISIYNDQGRMSRHWTCIKRNYVHGNCFTRNLLVFYTFCLTWGITVAKDTLKGNPLRSWKRYGKNNRGMSAMHDLIDWVGGYPFEVARPDEVFNFFHERGFTLQALTTCAGQLGCNEFVFEKNTHQ